MHDVGIASDMQVGSESNQKSSLRDKSKAKENYLVDRENNDSGNMEK